MSRILIIDDDGHMRRICSRVLSKAGHIVACAETGEEGLEKIRNADDPFEAVLLDQLMPGMSGMDVLEQTKAIAPNLPVIIITGSATEEATQELVAKGARDCLPKPFNPEQLRNAINKALI
jgi:DNA-binding NtrC family response regulator